MKKEVSYKIVSLVFAILVICFVIAFYVLGWTEPTAVPPGGNVPAPINVGGETQIKAGKIGLGVLSVDSNFMITTQGGGIKAESDIANQPAGYFSNTSGYAIITGSGNVGIGTTDPTRRLDIFGQNSSGISLGAAERIQTASGSDLGPALELWHSTNAGGKNYTILSTGSSNIGGAGLFQIAENTDLANPRALLSINSNGNVGIGTISPTAKLHIGGIVGTDGIKFPDGTLQTSAASITPGTWCGLKMSDHAIPLFNCAGHNPQVSCPIGYTGILFAVMGAYGGNWFTCVKN